MLNTKSINIGAAIMVRNMAPTIKATVYSLSWTDGIYIYDDGSTDNSSEIAASFSKAPIFVEKSSDSRSAFDRGEAKIRNYIILRAFEKLKVDVLIIIDADELMSANVKRIIKRIFSKNQYDSAALSMWHLYDKQSYLHFWATKRGNIPLLDPHTRIIIKGRYFEDIFEDGSHPAIIATEKTVFLNGPHHFHLKYFCKSPYPNFALDFLPKYPTLESIKPYLRRIPFELPNDVRAAINLVKWDVLKKMDTPYYKTYSKI